MRLLFLAASVGVGPAALGAPATVLDHTLAVTVDARGALDATQVWTVRIDDPGACSAGLLAPSGLSGASDGGARVLGDLLVIPGDTEPGTVFTLTATGRGRAPGHSGVFATAPDLPAANVAVSVVVPARTPLTVWADASGVPDYDRTRRARTARVTWTDVAEGRTATFAWSTWEDWDAAASRFEATHSPKLADRRALGRQLALGAEGMGIAGVVGSVREAVAVAPGDLGSFDTARPATEVLAAGSGTAAERALVLVSALTAAGYDAHLAAVRPADDPLDVPPVVPAPALLTRPAVAVRTDHRTVWIDPGSDHTPVPEIPAAYRGATAWVPGDVPRHIGNTGLHDGSVRVVGQATLQPDGTLAWNATLAASGAASEWLRMLLGPLDPVGRQDALRRLLAQGRAIPDRIAVDAQGMDDPARPLRITLALSEASPFEPVGTGLRGHLAPLLAPALAGWLPPNVLVHEEIGIAAGGVLPVRPLAVIDTDPTRSPHGIVSRAAEFDAQSVRLVTEAVRPYRRTTPAVDAAAATFFAEVASEGPEVLLFPPIDPRGAKAIRAAPAIADPADRWAIELLLWLAQTDERRARTTLRKATKDVGLAALVEPLARLSRPGDGRALELVWQLSETDALRRDIARALERIDARRAAWLVWADLIRSPDPSVRLDAYLAVARLEPDASPGPLDDPIGHQAWFPKDDLVRWARDAAAEAGHGEDGDPRLLRIDAEAALAAGHDAEAEVLFARAQRLDDDPALAVWIARAGARSRVDTGETVRALKDAVARAPYDPNVLAAASDVLSDVGAHDLALSTAVSAARHAFRDPALWLRVVDKAFAAADLATAAAAARRASDLDKSDADAARVLADMARLTADPEAAALAASRLGQPAPRAVRLDLEDLVTDLPPDRLLAVLAFHDEAVRRSARFLALRAQLRLAERRLDEAAADGLVLHQRMGDARGIAIAFAATVGRVWSAGMEDAVDAAAMTSTHVARTRLHWAVVTGARDPARLVRGLNDPHAETIATWLAAPDAGWEVLPEPTIPTPRGMRHNRFLSLSTGVEGWSDPSTATSVIATGAPLRDLPPPLSLIATPVEPAVATMAGGGRLVRLEGLEMPVYAAYKVRGEAGLIGLGFTPQAAELAVRAALPSE